MWDRSAATPAVGATSYSFNVETQAASVGDDLISRDSGCPIPPDAPSTATETVRTPEDVWCSEMVAFSAELVPARCRSRTPSLCAGCDISGRLEDWMDTRTPRQGSFGRIRLFRNEQRKKFPVGRSFGRSVGRSLQLVQPTHTGCVCRSYRAHGSRVAHRQAAPWRRHPRLGRRAFSSSSGEQPGQSLQP